MISLIIIEIDDDGATITELDGMSRILPTIEQNDLSDLVGGGITVSRVLSLTSDDAAAEVKEGVRKTLKSERDLPARDA